MIEQALLFAIGFLAATLAAVAAAPLLSRRAMRLAMARARLLAPVTEKQAIADMDTLRAQHAVARARLERRLALAEEASTGLRVAVGRQAAEIIRLRSDIADLDGQFFDARAEAERQASRARDLQATIGAAQFALHDAFAQRDRASANKEAAEARAAELHAEGSRLRARIAVVSARAEYVEGRVEDLTHMAKTARDKADQTAAELEAERTRTAALDARLATAADEGRSLADQLGAAHAAMEASLRTARAEREALQRENDALRREIAMLGDSARPAPGDAELRKSIESFGREVSRVFAAQKASEAKESSGDDDRPPGGRSLGMPLAPSESEAHDFVPPPRRRAGRSRSPER